MNLLYKQDDLPPAVDSYCKKEGSGKVTLSPPRDEVLWELSPQVLEALNRCFETQDLDER